MEMPELKKALPVGYGWFWSTRRFGYLSAPSAGKRSGEWEHLTPICMKLKAMRSATCVIKPWTRKPCKIEPATREVEMEQQSLWDALPYQAHSETSKEAAKSMTGKASSLRSKVLELLQSNSLTDEEIAIRLNLSGSTARPRRIELVQSGLVVQTGTRKTASGRSAAVWSVTPTNIGSNA